MAHHRGNAGVRRLSTVITVAAVAVASLLGAAAPAQADQKGDKRRPPTAIAVSASASGSTATVTYTIDARVKDIDDRDCWVNTARVSCGSVVSSTRRSTTFVTVIPGLVGHRHTFRIRAEIDDRRDANGSADITGINNAPVAVADSYTTDEDTPLNVAASGILGNDSDADGDALTAVLVTGPANGNLTLNANGSFTYGPAANFSGADSFTYRANDGAVNSSGAVVSITVRPVNDAPVAVDDAAATERDVPVTIPAASLLVNDSDADGDSLEVISVTAGLQGTVALIGTDVTFTPEGGFVGAAGFSYQVSDGQGGSDTASVTVDVTAPASAEDVCVAAGLGFLGDPAGEWACYGSATDAELAALAAELEPLCSPPASVRTQPAGNVTPPHIYCDTVPVAVDDAYEVTAGTTLVVTAPGLLANDTDAGGDTLNAAIIDQPTKGTLTGVSANGSFSYTPDAGASGTDSFTYVASGTSMPSAPATVTITITAAPPPPPPPSNTAPIARNDAIVIDPIEQGSAPVILNVLANDSDPEGSPLTAEIVQVLDPPFAGTLTLNANGFLVFTRDSQFLGHASISYVAKDASLQSSPAFVDIFVNPPGSSSDPGSSNKAPIARDNAYSTVEDLALYVPLGFLVNDNDPEGASLTELVIARPQHGLLEVNPDKSFRYTPDPNFSGTDTFTYVVRDPSFIWSNVATVTIDVVALNDATVAVDDAYTAQEGVLLSVPEAQGVLANDVDVDSTVAGAAVVASPANGVLNLNPDGSFDYTPNTGFTGTDTFTYRPGGTPQANVATVTITVTSAP